jgi:hypothetical protein
VLDRLVITKSDEASGARKPGILCSRIRGVDAIDQITGSALQMMEGPVHGVLIAPQAASDADMVSLWLGNSIPGQP